MFVGPIDIIIIIVNIFNVAYIILIIARTTVVMNGNSNTQVI